MKKIAVFTDCDLDGLSTYQVFRWYTDYEDVKHEICSQSNFRKTFQRWAKRNRPSDFDKIYIFDLDVSQNNIDLVDYKNFVIIDHHDSHVRNKDKYKYAKTALKEYTSCCKLLYSMFKHKYEDKKLTIPQKLLVLLTDDYDSYELKMKDSYNLNVVVWNYAGDRAGQFLRDFGDGFKGFSDEHRNMIHFNNKQVSRILSELQVFSGVIPISGKDYHLCATMADKCLNEVAHHVIEKHGCDICLVVNMRTRRVSFRKNKEQAFEVDLGKLAASLADGGGHIHSAGGSLTDRVMTLTKILKPV